MANGEGVVNAVLPGANITDIMVTMDHKFRIVLEAFNNTSLYQKLYWSAIGYRPTAKQATQGSGSFWKIEYTAGMLCGGRYDVWK